MGTIVCGVDRSLGARTAVLTAVDLGCEFGVEVVAVHVVPSVQRELDVYLGERAQRTASELVASMLEGNEDAPDITVLGSVGDRAERLTRVAREHDASLIVLGARTQGESRAFLRSRLAAELLEAGPVPVVVVPPELQRSRTGGRPPRRTTAMNSGQRFDHDGWLQTVRSWRP
jgi:nucleotide-binding universal stress UspA family protein